MTLRFTSEPIEPKFEDCKGCQHYHRTRQSSICRKCDVGEHFKEKISDEIPDDDELMRIYARMHEDDSQY